MGPDGMMGNKPPMGNGMVKQAASTMQNRPYHMHVQEAKSLGQQPMTPQEFMAKMGQ
jgi:hypothetical protein